MFAFKDVVRNFAVFQTIFKASTGRSFLKQHPKGLVRTWSETLHTYRNTYLHLCLSTYIPIYLHTYLHICFIAVTKTYIYKYLHKYTYMYIVHIYMYTFLHITCTYALPFSSTFTCLYSHIYLFPCIYFDIHIYLFPCIYIYIYMYIHVQK